MLFGEEYVDAPPKKVAGHHEDDHDDDHHGPHKEPLCCGVLPRQYVTPVFSLVLLVALGLAILIGAGATTTAPSRPKAIIYVIEGLRATTFEEMAVQGSRAPNIQQMINRGKHAPCYGRSDTRCCRTQNGVRLGPQYTFQSAPGIASIFTGVDAVKHQVYNTSFDAMLRFASTSSQVPTFLKTAINAGLRTGAVATNAMLTTVGESQNCNAYGVLDFECGAAAISRCMRSSSCNLAERMPLVSGNGIPPATYADDMIADAKLLLAHGVDVIVVHFTRVNKAATATPGGNFTSQSRPYAAQLYIADSLIGQMNAIITRRATDFQENWLIIGTSDHGGHNSTFGDMIDTDDVVPLFAQVITATGNAPLQDAVVPTTHMDVAPTVLEWFGLLTPEISANMDGRVQFVCGVGATGGNCTSM